MVDIVTDVFMASSSLTFAAADAVNNNLTAQDRITSPTGAPPDDAAGGDAVSLWDLIGGESPVWSNVCG